MQTSDIGILVLRIVIGLTFAAHGAQKALGWWQGPGPAGWRSAMEKMGFLPAPFWAELSAMVELVGGLLLAIGLLTPLAAAALVAQAVVIVGKVHLPNGFWNKASGIEFPLALLAAVASILLTGPGLLSIDGIVRITWAQPVLLGLLVLGILAGLVALAVPMRATRSSLSPKGR